MSQELRSDHVAGLSMAAAFAMQGRGPAVRHAKSTSPVLYCAFVFAQEMVLRAYTERAVSKKIAAARPPGIVLPGPSQLGSLAPPLTLPACLGPTERGRVLMRGRSMHT